MSAKVAEQAIQSYDEIKMKVFEIEDKYVLVQRHLENSLLNNTYNTSFDETKPSRIQQSPSRIQKERD